MPEYYGVAAIAERMNLHSDTIAKLIHAGNLLAYQRRNPSAKCRTRMWYTNDQLILVSEIRRARRDIARKKEKRAARRQHKLAMQSAQNAQNQPAEAPQQVVVEAEAAESGPASD